MSWTDERVEELGRLWDAGHSTSDIGKALGVTKNAVVGKAHRMKLASRPSPIRRTAMPQRHKVTLPPRPVVETKREPVYHAPRVQNGGPGCLWPFGHPGDADFHFCGANAVEGKPYCPEHCARAYIQKVRPESRAA